MGYDFFITRKINWNDVHEKSSISFDEWLQYVHSDNELLLENGYWLYVQGQKKFISEPGYCIWIAHPLLEGTKGPFFAYEFGAIQTKNADQYTINKMISIASVLAGKLIGEDGEFY